MLTLCKALWSWDQTVFPNRVFKNLGQDNFMLGNTVQDGCLASLPLWPWVCTITIPFREQWSSLPNISKCP